MKLIIFIAIFINLLSCDFFLNTIYKYGESGLTEDVPIDPSVLRIGLVAEYLFQSDSSDTAGNNHGTVNGPVLTTDRNDNPDSAYYFDGIDDYINIEDNIALKFSTELTVSCWVFSQEIQNHQRIINKWDPSSYVFAINLQSSSYFFEVLDQPENIPDQVYSSLIEENQWTHITVTYDSDNLRIYINGNLENTTPFSKVLYQGDTPLYIGAGESASDLFFNGKIDDIRFHNRALSDQEVQALYNE